MVCDALVVSAWRNSEHATGNDARDDADHAD